jgi:hypothetical protein
MNRSRSMVLGLVLALLLSRLLEVPAAEAQAKPDGEMRDRVRFAMIYEYVWPSRPCC